MFVLTALMEDYKYEVFETTNRVKKANASMMNRIICYELINVLFSN